MRAQIWPDALVYVSVSKEKYTRFSSFVWGRCVKRLEVPRPARSSFFVAFQRRRCASHATDSDKSCITVVGFILLNGPEFRIPLLLRNPILVNRVSRAVVQ